MRRQRIENGCLSGGLALTETVVGAPQQESAAATVRHRIDLARRQIVEALLGIMENRDERGNFRIRVVRR